MKKTLIALAALAATGAFAQSSVTIYGQVDMGIATLKDEVPTGDYKKTGVMSGNQYTSRLGFKGTEDLGGGLKANFVLEYELAPDEKGNTSNLTSRVGTVGLSGEFGALTIGRQVTPYYVVETAMDLVGNNNNLNNTPGYLVNAHKFNSGRADNAVQYTSPNISGFTGAIQVSSGTKGAETVTGLTGNGSVGKGYGLSGVYVAGPLVAGVAYDSITNPGTNVAGMARITDGVSVAGFGAGSTEVKVWAAGASYDFGVAKASLAYSDLTDAKKVGADVKSKGYNLSVAVPFGATTVAANLGRATVSQDNTTFDATITGYQLLASYALSKRTNAYATYGNDKTENAGVDLLKRTSTAVGIRHTF